MALDTGRYKRFDRMTPQERHDRRLSWFIAEAQRQAVNRARMAKCERYYDSYQTDPEKAQALLDRGQDPVVINEIFPNINWLIGTERRNRIDFHVMPTEALDPQTTKDAETKTKLIKWLDSTNKTGFERSFAWAQAMKAGIGWMEVGARGDPTDAAVYSRAENWRNILWDSIGSTRLDIQDGRYLFRLKVVDLDLAIAFFPDKEEQLLKSATQGDDRQTFSSWLLGTGGLNLSLFDVDDRSSDGIETYTGPLDLFNPRERVLLVECWSREPDYLKKSRKAGKSSLYDQVAMRVRCSIMTEFDTLYEDWSPYKHDRFPFVPKWAYRDSRTGLPYSPIWPLLDKQDALNNAVSKAMFEMSVNQTLAEEGAFNKEIMGVEDISDELATPDGVAIFANGALSGNKVQTRRGIEKANAHFLLADRLTTAMQNESSVTAENRGMNSNAISGKAIGLKQDQGGTLSTELFDNDLLSRQLEGELTLSVMEQFLVKPMVVAVPGERRQSQMVEINKPQPDGTVMNDITARSARFVIGEQAWRQSLGMAAFESMMDLLGKLAPVAPQVVTSILDLVFEYADVPNKEALLSRIRQATGQPGPDNQQSPEQQQAIQQKQQVAQAQFQAQMAQLQADVRVAQANGDKLEAEAILARLTAMYESAQGAQILAAAPGITPVADELLKSAGFKDQNAPGPIIDPTAQPAGPAGQPVPPPQQADGALVGHQAGIGTPNAPDAGAQPGVQP